MSSAGYSVRYAASSDGATFGKMAWSQRIAKEVDGFASRTAASTAQQRITDSQTPIAA